MRFVFLLWWLGCVRLFDLIVVHLCIRSVLVVLFVCLLLLFVGCGCLFVNLCLLVWFSLCFVFDLFAFVVLFMLFTFALCFAIICLWLVLFVILRL